MQMSQNACGVAYRHHMTGEVFDDHGSGSDYAVRTDGNPVIDHSSGPDARMRTDVAFPVDHGSGVYTYKSFQTAVMAYAAMPVEIYKRLQYGVRSHYHSRVNDDPGCCIDTLGNVCKRMNQSSEFRVTQRKGMNDLHGQLRMLEGQVILAVVFGSKVGNDTYPAIGTLTFEYYVEDNGERGIVVSQQCDFFHGSAFSVSKSKK